MYLHFCVQKQNILDVLAGKIPDSKYVVLCSSGGGFDVVEKINGKWEGTWVKLTPENVPELVKLPGRTVIAMGCTYGREELAKAFIDTGCRAYIASGADGTHIDQDSNILFVIAFFYHLLSSSRDPHAIRTDKQAVEKAAVIDTEFKEGTHLYRYYDSQHKWTARLI